MDKGGEFLAIYCGVDIVEIDRIKHSFGISGSAFRDKVFTENEINYCENRKNAMYASYAARFAGKEAVSKAFGTGIGESIKWKDIEILNNELGKPYVVLTGSAGNKFKSFKGIGISISLSHCKTYAVAYAVMEVLE
jgi:holo-[acyl-carrier protein] synthase